MKRWENRVALVTGASDGTIGGAIAVDLVKNGMTVIGCARNVSQVEVISCGLAYQYKVYVCTYYIHYIVCEKGIGNCSDNWQ